MELIIPTRQYHQSYAEAIEEYREHQIRTYEFLDITKGDIFQLIENYRAARELPPGYVGATYLWLVDGNEFLGEISIRHALTDSLLRFGGNIGYGIRYSRWNQGLGTKMLSMALKFAKEDIGLDRVLITCNDDNLGSAAVIEKNGGILQDKIENVVDGTKRLTRRYWITIG